MNLVTLDTVYEHAGESLPLRDWVARQEEFLVRGVYERCEELTSTCVLRRLQKGWSLADALSMPSFTTGASLSVPAGHPGSWSWGAIPYDDDDHAWYVDAHHPEGLSLQEVAAVLGVSTERASQIEISAMRKFCQHAKGMGIDVRKLLMREDS